MSSGELKPTPRLGHPSYFAKPDTSKMIFVFGSNEAGIHGAGAARFALEKKGAVWGQGYGLHGQSFAIPTKDRSIQTLPLKAIRQYVDAFIRFSQAHPEMKFQVTAIGCGLAGYEHKDIAPLFWAAMSNCYFDSAWEGLLVAEGRYWGTF